jgi:hypothetical protein
MLFRGAEGQCGQANNGGGQASNEQPDGLSFRHRIRVRPSDPLGVHKQQHDPTDERERSDDGRDKVADCGLKVHSEELDRLSRSRKGDARVSEHHNAESDQEDCNNGFCIHIDSSVFSSVGSFLIQSPATGDEVDEHHDNGNYQQDVNEPAHRVTAHQPQRPQNEQYYRNRP